MIKKCCKIIPDDILKKIAEEEGNTEKTEIDKELSTFVREFRHELQDKPTVKKKLVEDVKKKVTHKEVRRLFDSKNVYGFSTDPIAVDEQVNSSKPSAYHPLQLANIVYDYFDTRFGLESYDNANAPIDIHINFGNKYNNAFWDGLRMVFGNGDGKYFNSFTTQNIFTHEFTHAITENLCGLKYENQSGALNEHYSDVFAVCVDQKVNGRQKPSAASWIIGEGLFNQAKIKGKGLRSFKNEKAYENTIIGTDPQPKHMKDYQNLPNDEDGDYGGVHINSGIPNRAFYEFCIKAEKEVGDEPINYSWRAPATIWFETYRRINPDTQFREFAFDTIAVCKKIHPQLVKVLKDAWTAEVGVLP